MLTGYFIPGPDTTGAEIKPDCRAVNIKGCRLNIGLPGAPGMLLGVAYPVAETQRFSTHITFASQF